MSLRTEASNNGDGFCLGKTLFRALSANLLRNSFESLVSPALASASVNSGGTMSSNNDGTPALARCAAMPQPITPEPRTATLLIFIEILRFSSTIENTRDENTRDDINFQNKISLLFFPWY